MCCVVAGNLFQLAGIVGRDYAVVVVVVVAVALAVAVGMLAVVVVVVADSVARLHLTDLWVEYSEFYCELTVFMRLVSLNYHNV